MVAHAGSVGNTGREGELMRRIARRRGFTLLELAMVITTIVLLFGATAEGMRTANRNTAAGATREIISTLMVRAGAEAIGGEGTYSVSGLRRSVVGLQVNSTLFAFDCSTVDGTSNPGVFAPGCPAITLGPQENAVLNLGARDPGEMVAHLSSDSKTVVVVTKAVNNQCVIGRGRVDDIDPVTLSAADGDGVCRIPVELVP